MTEGKGSILVMEYKRIRKIHIHMLCLPLSIILWPMEKGNRSLERGSWWTNGPDTQLGTRHTGVNQTSKTACLHTPSSGSTQSMKSMLGTRDGAPRPPGTWARPAVLPTPKKAYPLSQQTEHLLLARALAEPKGRPRTQFLQYAIIIKPLIQIHCV